MNQLSLGGIDCPKQIGRVLRSLIRNNNAELIESTFDDGLGFGATDPEGNTALHLAVKTKANTSLLKLIELGANLSSTNREGLTALHIACRNNNVAAVEILLNAGADPFQKGDYLWSHINAFDICRRYFHQESADLLQGKFSDKETFIPITKPLEMQAYA